MDWGAYQAVAIMVFLAIGMIGVAVLCQSDEGDGKLLFIEYDDE